MSFIGKDMDVSAIILMGGEGKRFSSSLPKQFHKLSGKQVYLYTLEAFIKSKLFQEIILVCHQSYTLQIQNDIADLVMAYPNISIIEAGLTRQESSFKGIQKASFENVVIHDAVRPFISYQILKDNIDALKRSDAVDTCIATADTIIHTKDLKNISAIPKRSEYMRGQTPQSFKKELILQAHKEALKKNIQNASDDCQLILNLYSPISIVQGSETNIKITSSFDLCIAEHLLRLQSSSLDHQNLEPLQGKTFVVTGATGGIGKEICKLLEKEQAKVIKLSLSSTSYPIDLTDFKNSKKLFHKLNTAYGSFDGLINSVGFLSLSSIKDLQENELNNLINCNFKALTHSCKFCPLKDGAHIINIASSSYSRGRQNYAVYSAMKAAVVNFTQALSEEMPKQFINALIPKRTKTKMRLKNFPEEDASTLFSPKLTAEKVIEILKTKHLTGMTVEIKERNEA